MDEPGCALLVMSCSAYRDLWTPFFTLFLRYWPDCPFEVYLGTDCGTFDDPRVTTLAVGNRQWSNRLRACLERIRAHYVLLLLEDYFFTEAIRTETILTHLHSLRALEGTVLRLYPRPGPDLPLKGRGDIGRIHAKAPYRISTQAAIWNGVRLAALLRDDESIWDFERKGSLRSQRNIDGFYSTYEVALPYRQVVERGQWFRRAAKYYEEQQIGCDFGARPVMGPLTAIKKSIHAGSKNFLNTILPIPLRIRL